MIILLNGPMNSGKSTIAKLLVQKMPSTVNLEVDTLFQFLDHLENVDVERIIWENVLVLTQSYIDNKLSVIVSYVFGEAKANVLVNKLSNTENEVYLFTLSPGLKLALANRGTRELNNDEKERIKLHYAQGIHTSTKGIVIDNSTQTPDETVKLILAKIAATKKI